MSFEIIWELFHFAILAALLAGAVCPWIGCFLLVRRTGFYGVALPQFAASGVALGWAIPVWLVMAGQSPIDLEHELMENPHTVKNYLLGMAGLTTFGGTYLLHFFGRHKETETGRVAAAFAVASAATILLAMVSPHGSEVVDQLMRGEILTIDLHEFETIAVAYVLVALLLARFHRPLLLASFDRDMALSLGLRVNRLEALLLFLAGLTVAVGVLIVGPIVLFGLLVLPPLAAQGLARSMRSFTLLAIGLGVLSAAGGVAVSFAADWPLGPSVVAVAGVVLALSTLVARLRG